jgi:hypothetical protein
LATGFFVVVVFFGVVAVFAVVVVFAFAVVVVVFFLVLAVVEVLGSASVDGFALAALPFVVEVVAGVVVAGVVAALWAAAGVVVAAFVPDGESLPQPANTRASTTPVVTVSLRGTAPTIAPGAKAVCRT